MYGRSALIAVAAAGLAWAAADPVEVEVRGVQLDPTTGSPVVQLVEKGKAGRALPIWIGPFEAQANATYMSGTERSSRAVDLILAAGSETETVLRFSGDVVITGLVVRDGAPVPGVAVGFAAADTAGATGRTDARGAYEVGGLEPGEYQVTVQGDNTYFATLHLAGADGKDIAIDARPSDAIALALRLHGPILVADEVFAKSRATHVSPAAAHLWGLTVQDLTPDIAAFFKASAAKGVLVSDVGDDADAHEALRGDVITALDGEPVHSVLELADRAGAHAATKPVRLSVRRGARDLTISFPLR